MTVPAELLGRRVVSVLDLTRPWASDVRTRRATLEDGLVVVHQAGLPTAAGRAGIARRMRLSRSLAAAAAPGLLVPAVLDGDPGADPPFLVTAFVPGRTGAELLGSDSDAVVLGRAAGAAARAIAAIPPRSLGTRLPGLWGDAGLLSAAALRWLGGVRATLSPSEIRSVAGTIDGIPGLLAAPAVLAHGDLAPVNLVIDDGRMVGLLDLERLRVAPAGFDAAWFRFMVRHHHPERWPVAGPAFLEAANLGDELHVRRRLDDLAVLACLEHARLPGRSPARCGWVARAREVLHRELPGP